MNDAPPPARVQIAPAGGVLEIRLDGSWRLTEERPLWRDLQPAEKPARVRIRAEGLESWDSALALFLREVNQWADANAVTVETADLPEGAAKLADLLAAKPAQSAEPHAPPPGMFAAVGLVTLGLWSEIKDLAGLVGECAYSTARFFRGTAQFRWRDCVNEMQQCGAMALPIVGLISFLVGVTLAYTGSLVVRQYGGDIWLADMVGLAITREMGPMMAAIVLAGRTGAAYAATLGNMKANEEIDALSTLGVSPIDFLVMPRMAALFLMMPFLALYSDAMGVLGGMAIAALPPLNISPNLFWAEMQTIVDLSDINTGVIKAALFGVLVGLSGCLRGLQADRSAVGVGVAATRAVVTAILLIIICDSVCAVAFNILGW